MVEKMVEEIVVELGYSLHDIGMWFLSVPYPNGFPLTDFFEFINPYAMVNEFAQEIYDNFNEKYIREFVTVIIGSGASASPKTNILIDEVISELGKDVYVTNSMVHFGKTKDVTLEESFSILAKIKGEKSVPNLLKDKEIIKRDDNINPTNGYEFLAHLANRKLINNIISTNFDEELEISLDDEIGKDNYRIVKSLSEFDAFNMEIESKNDMESKNNTESKKLILFKVHGTISYPRTIRATIGNVKKFEKDKLNAIRWILCNTKILIIIGFGFNDIDFQHAFSEALNDKANKESDDKMLICWVHKRDASREMHRDFLNSITSKKSIYRRIGKKYLVTMDSNVFLKELAKNIEQYAGNKKVPTIARQNIRNLIMKTPGGMDIRERKFYIELIIFALTAKGLFGINALRDCSRVQRYCNEFIASKCSPYALLENLEKNKLIKRLDENNNIYSLNDTDINTLTNSVIDFFDLKALSCNEKKELESQLTILGEAFDVDIDKPDASVYLMFNDPQPIRNHIEWEEKTRIFLKDATELCIIAQTGEWITKETNKKYFNNFKNKGGKLNLITCEKFADAGMHSKRQIDVERTLISMFGRQIEIRYLPWEGISEHIKLNDKNQGMYMSRIEKSSVVAPVWVDNNVDGELLRKMFNNYWRDSKPSSCVNDVLPSSGRSRHSRPIFCLYQKIHFYHH